MATYKQKQRKKYATVGKDRYPIGDKVHAQKALQFINKGGLSPAEKEDVRRRAAEFGVGQGSKDTEEKKATRSPTKKDQSNGKTQSSPRKTRGKSA